MISANLAGPVLAAADPPATQGNSNTMMLVFLGLAIVGLFWMQRRSKKKATDANAFRNELAAGQRVMTMSGMIGLISRVDGDVITIMSASGDESAWIRRAIRSVVPDDEWEAMTAEYPDDPDAEDATDSDADSVAPAASDGPIDENRPTNDEPGAPAQS